MTIEELISGIAGHTPHYTVKIVIERDGTGEIEGEIRAIDCLPENKLVLLDVHLDGQVQATRTLELRRSLRWLVKLVNTLADKSQAPDGDEWELQQAEAALRRED